MRDKVYTSNKYDASVAVATSLCHDKMYTLPLILDNLNKHLKHVDACYVACNTVDGWPDLDISLLDTSKVPIYSEQVISSPEDTIVARCSAVRNAARNWFLSEKYTHILYLDSDIWLDGIDDAVGSLLSANKHLATGIYPLRDFTSVIVPQIAHPIDVDLDVPTHGGVSNGILNAQYIRPMAYAFGMGIMLVSKEAISKVGFRVGAGLDEYGEDFGFCVDCRSLGYDLAVVPSVSAWHVMDDMTGAKIVIEKDLKFGVVWQDFPTLVTNKYGVWRRGVPRFDISADVISDLGPGFVSGAFQTLRLETKEIRING